MSGTTKRPSEGDTAWDHFLDQHHKSPKAEGFVRGFYGPMTAAATAAVALQSTLDVDAASGDRLDKIGTIVGASRYLPQGITLAYFGFITQPSGRGFGQARLRHDGEQTSASYTAGDSEYRTLIKAKIAQNNAHGTAQEIAEAAKLVFKAPVASARDNGPGKIELWVGRIPSADEGLGRVVPDYLPRAAGISISIVFWSPDLPFGFRSNGHFGFGVGVMARSPLS